MILLAMTFIGTIGKGEEQFTILSFPPRICENQNGNLYSIILPNIFMGAVITVMLVIIGWIIYKVR